MLTPEQQHYLDEGNAHRRRYYGGGLPIPKDQGLTDALAWWAAYWRERAGHLDAGRMAARQGDLYGADA